MSTMLSRCRITAVAALEGMAMSLRTTAKSASFASSLAALAAGFSTSTSRKRTGARSRSIACAAASITP